MTGLGKKVQVSRRSLLVGFLLVVVLVSSLFVCVFVNSSCGSFLDGAVHVRSESELKNAVNSATSKEFTITLDSDITLTSELRIPADKDITLTRTDVSNLVF